MANEWVKEAAETYLALGQMLDDGEVPVSEVPTGFLHNLFLCSCLAYYQDNEPFIKDECFDLVCRELSGRAPEGIWWADRTWNPDNFRAGTGFDLDYPDQIRRIGKEIGYRQAMRGLAPECVR